MEWWFILGGLFVLALLVQRRPVAAEEAPQVIVVQTRTPTSGCLPAVTFIFGIVVALLLLAA